MEKEQIERILLSDDVGNSLDSNIDIVLKIIPEIKGMIGFQHKHPHHHLDVYNHTKLALMMSVRDLEIRWALLLHDIGKPYSYQEGEVRHFKGHPEVSMGMAKIILERLGYEESLIDKVCRLIKEHDTPIDIDVIDSDLEYYTKLYYVQGCDALAHHPEKLEKRIQYLKMIREYLSYKGIKLEKVYEGNN